MGINRKRDELELSDAALGRRWRGALALEDGDKGKDVRSTITSIVSERKA